MYSENNTLIYTRKCKAGVFEPSIIFTSWCPGTSCITPNTTSMFVTLLDSWGDGWSGNTIALKQNGTVVGSFGENFTTGHQYGPVEIVVRRGVDMQVVVGVFGSWTN